MRLSLLICYLVFNIVIKLEFHLFNFVTASGSLLPQSGTLVKPNIYLVVCQGRNEG